jgi:HK97 family phage major capsid protein
MLKQFKEAQQKVEALRSEVQGLLEKESLTADESTLLDTKVTELETATQNFAAVKGRNDTLTKAAQMLKEVSNELPVNKVVREGGAAGEVRMGYNAAGQMIAEEDEIDNAQLQKIMQMTSEPSYIKSFRAYLAKGANTEDMYMKELEQAKFDARLGDDSLGGYLSPPVWMMSLLKKSPYPVSLSDMVGKTVLGASDSLTWPRLEYNGASDDSRGVKYTSSIRIQRAGEIDDPTKVGPLRWGATNIQTNWAKMEIPVPRQLLQDASINPLPIIQELMLEAYRLGSEDEMLNNTGVQGPQGMLTTTGETFGIPEFNVGNPLDAGKLMELYADLPPQYRNAAYLLMNDYSTFVKWCQLKNGDGNYIFGVVSALQSTLVQARQEQFLGRPIKFSPFMPEDGSGAKAAIWGDLSRIYRYVIRMGMTVEQQLQPRDEFAYTVVRYRDGGKVVEGYAGRVAKRS